MNKIIKITLLTFVIVFVIAIVTLFMSSINGANNVYVVPFNFEKHIQSCADRDIKGQEYAQATAGFDNIIEEIKTEHFVTLSNCQHGISDEIEQKCYKMAFFPYAPIFTNYSESFFEGSSWNKIVMDSLRWRANSLLNMNIAERNTDVYRQLEETIKNVDDYYAILRLIERSKSCSSVQSAKGIIEQATSYHREPLTNNTILCEGLNSIPKNAKFSCAESIKKYCYNIANNYLFYRSYEDFYSNYERATNQIDAYNNAFPNSSQFDDVLKRLAEADSDAMEYYKRDI